MYFFFVICAAGFAQQFPAPYPTYNPSVFAAGASAGAAASALRSSQEAKSKAAELKIQQGWLDLARQQDARAQASSPQSSSAGAPIWTWQMLNGRSWMEMAPESKLVYVEGLWDEIRMKAIEVGTTDAEINSLTGLQWAPAS